MTELRAGKLKITKTLLLDVLQLPVGYTILEVNNADDERYVTLIMSGLDLPLMPSSGVAEDIEAIVHKETIRWEFKELRGE